MEKVFKIILRDSGGTLAIDGATENIAKAILNAILHTPYPMFMELLPADMKRRKTAIVGTKLMNTIRNIEQKVGCPCVTNFISDSCDGMRNVRKKLVEQKVVKLQYVCAPHCLTNFTEEIRLLLFKDEIKFAV